SSGNVQGQPTAIVTLLINSKDVVSRQELMNLLKQLQEGKAPADIKLDNDPAFNPFPIFEQTFDRLGVNGLVDWTKVENSGWREVPVQFGSPQKLALEMHRHLKQIQPPALTTLSAQEAFVVFVKVALVTGFVIGSPWIFYQLWMFVA